MLSPFNIGLTRSYPVERLLQWDEVTFYPAELLLSWDEVTFNAAELLLTWDEVTFIAAELLLTWDEVTFNAAELLWPWDEVTFNAAELLWPWDEATFYPADHLWPWDYWAAGPIYGKSLVDLASTPCRERQSTLFQQHSPAPFRHKGDDKPQFRHKTRRNSVMGVLADR